MKIRTCALVAPFVLACSFGLCQIPTDNAGVLNDQQNTSVDCTDPVMASSQACASATQGQTQLPGNKTRNPGLDSTNETSGQRVRSLGPAPAEGAPLGRQTSTRVPLPPDQPTEFQKFITATTGQSLPIYGVDLFRNVPSTFAPNDLGPVTPEYVIGPDDELRIRIWGQINFEGNVRVDRTGEIYLPQVGSISVAGLPFSQLDQRLREAVARLFKNFDLSVTVGHIRSMQIFLTGEARRPGAYTVSSLTSLVDALFATGGPSPEGSLRHIQLNRDGKTIADLDLYALLMHGDKSHDVRLLPEDVIYVPIAGPQVAIVGSIRNPGIYELLGRETIGDLLKEAGQPTAVASTARISLERLEDHKLRQAMEFGFESSSLDTPLAEGDIVRIYSIVPAYQKTVTLRGNVANPGRFSWHEGMRISNLIPDRDSLLTREYWWKRSRLGLPVPEFDPAPNDAQQLYGGVPTPPTGSSESNGAIALSGLPSAPGESGGDQPRKTDVRVMSPEIDWDYAVIERLDPDTLRTDLIPFDLGKLVLKHDANQDLPLRPGDTITIFSQGDIHTPVEHQTKYVDLEGEFVHSGVYSVQPGETLRDLIRRAGGFSQKAYLYGSEFTRESTQRVQQQRLNEYVQAVSIEGERGTQALAASGTTSGSSASDVAASRQLNQDLVSRLSQIHATGRIVLEFKPNSSSIDDVPELNLENGDRFLVPSVPSNINVVGAVYDQNSFVYRSGRTVSFYLHLAGGANRNADRRHTFVIRADGSVISRSSVRNEWGMLGSDAFYQVRMNPGDTLVVPDKTLRPTAIRGLLDWTQLFSQLALGAAAVNVLK